MELGFEPLSATAVDVVFSCPVLKRLLGLLGKKPRAEASDPLAEFVDSLTMEERGLMAVIGAYAWKFIGMDRRDALVHGIKTVRLLRSDHPNPELRLEAQRTVEGSRQWFAHFGNAAMNATEEFAHSIVGKEREPSTRRPEDPGRPLEPPPALTGEQAFSENIIKFKLQREDMTPLSVIAAFCWKYMNMPPPRAVVFAMQTIYLSRYGSPEDKANANTTWESAIKWDLDTPDLDTWKWGIECIEIVRAGKG